jgi:hypothetical protein
LKSCHVNGVLAGISLPVTVPASPSKTTISRPPWPAPGEYETSGLIARGGAYRKPAITIPHADLRSENILLTPGPGAYDTAGDLESREHGVSFKGSASERDGARGNRLLGYELDAIPGAGTWLALSSSHANPRCILP